MAAPKGAVQRSEHDNKYDRQMRLWGGHGQKAIETSHICVLGSSGVAAEVLKNLVLPNVGEFTVIDDAKVTAQDCGNNFFVTQDDIGQSRAETVTKWLLEMNPDVKGHSVNKSAQTVIEKEDLKFFNQFTMVIATQLFGTKLHRKLADHLYCSKIPYLCVKVNGLLASFRVQFDELTITESHPTNDRTDLYIYPSQLALFPELSKFIESYDLKTKDIEKAAHLPAIAILGQYTEQWKKSHDGKLPQGFKEQNEFKDNIRKMGDGENYDDAVHWAYQCYNEPRIDTAVKKVLADKKGEKLDENSTNYWVLVRSLRDFMENEGKGFLPVSTNIPDFHTDSKSYVNLKKIYQARYEKDLATITKYVEKRLGELKRDVNSIDKLEIERFVKHCRDLQVVRTRSVKEEFDSPDCEHIEEQYTDWSLLEEGKADDDDADAPPPAYNPKIINWYWALRVADMFYDENGRLPGSQGEDKDVAADAKALADIQKKLFSQIKVEQDVDLPCLEEISRYGGAEVHNMSSLLGGVVAGSSMKILMKQFYPMNHTFVYNGIHCSGEVYQV